MFIISIVEEGFPLTKLKIYYKNHANDHIEMYVRFPGSINTTVCLQEMEKYIDDTIKKGDITGLLEASKKFFFENDLKYYEVYKVG